MNNSGNRRGIVLAGGAGTRLYPSTKVVNKHLLPVYDKPMVYYPLSVLMLAGIREVLVISTPKDTGNFLELFRDGEHLGMDISYTIQRSPNGIAEAFTLGEHFIKHHPVALVLGDNVFYGHGFQERLCAANDNEKATIFVHAVKDPQRFGVAELDDQENVKSIVEKPENPRSNYAVTGLYFYPNSVIDIAKTLEPSERGELEITDVNNAYIEKHQLRAEVLGRGFAWLDTGNHEALLQASNFIAAIERRQGLRVACVEEIAYLKGFINIDQFTALAVNSNDRYLMERVAEAKRCL